MTKPLLSIGIIFKNDIRCIERCLKALQPLRDAAPCELVMADTGSVDGSREIAEQYADILIDFPWNNDFSAARNAVIDRCTGLWYLSVDTDEYLDPDVSELVRFLCLSDQSEDLVALVNIRNYKTYEMDGDYSDFTAGRMFRMSTGIRYKGAIHEHLDYSGEVKASLLMRTIFHHDGYVGLYSGNAAGKEKVRRNTEMIRKALEQDPDNLLLLMQLIETGCSSSAETSPDFKAQLRRAAQLVREKADRWEQVGPPVLRTILFAAERLDMPEWAEWLELAEERFPESMFIKLDVQYAAFVHEWNAGKDPAGALLRGERYLKALEDYRNGVDPLAQMVSPLQMATPFSECTAKIHMINGYCIHNRIREAFDLVQSLDYSLLDKEQMAKLADALQIIQFKSFFDTVPVITKIWDQISDPSYPEEKAAQWKSVMVQAAGKAFLRKNREAEQKKENYARHAYTLYLPLRGKFEVGTAAAVMEMQDSGEIEQALAEVQDWNIFSIYALHHALEYGAQFPLPGHPLSIEETDGLAARLSKDKERFFQTALHLIKKGSGSGEQQLAWHRGLILADIRTFDWGDTEAGSELGLELARTFADLERQFLPAYYAAPALTVDGLFLLPAMHRFGWYCVQAFEALDAGGAADYVRLLREGLETCKSMKPMVEFLLDHTPELQVPSPSAELQALAEQIRTVLSDFASDDPAVAVLKQSKAYQKVAYLIEGTEPPIVGGQMQ